MTHEKPVDVHLFAAARAAAGVDLMHCAPGPLGNVLNHLASHSSALAEVLPRCSYLIDGVAARNSDREMPVPPGGRLDVLPPFAGG
jgi:molybdopterin converting factor small subunit